MEVSCGLPEHGGRSTASPNVGGLQTLTFETNPLKDAGFSELLIKVSHVTRRKPNHLAGSLPWVVELRTQ